MSKRLRLAKYSKKIVCCNKCPMLHEADNPMIGICQAGMCSMIIMKAAALGIPKNCPLEDFE